MLQSGKLIWSLFALVRICIRKDKLLIGKGKVVWNGLNYARGMEALLCLVRTVASKMRSASKSTPALVVVQMLLMLNFYIRLAQ
jgi:hypothetical protein